MPGTHEHIARLASPVRASRIALDGPAVIWANTSAWSWNTVIPRHYFNFWVLLEGAVAMTLRGTRYVRSQPCYFLLPPGEPVAAVNAGGGPIRNFALHVRRSCLDPRRAARFGAATWGTPVRNFEGFIALARLCVDAGRRAAPSQQALAASLAHALLAQFAADTATPPGRPVRERMFSIAGRIRDNPESPWRIGALARESGYSRSRFTRLFEESNGLAPRPFITRCRMERARTLLKDSAMSVTEIADALGYGDVYFFSRHFKQATGASPLAWRRGA